MGIQASFGNDLKKIERDLSRLGQSASKVVAISATEAAKFGRTVARRTVTSTYNVKSGDVLKTMSVKAASSGNMTAELKVASPFTPIIKT